ncbi:hypothetical protein BGZ49_001594 [Haplosporangium sp. Z 27]|nr:hypothetical protein BGZ49_001594 [Haplosporangium sp. Z 27]
MEWTTLTSCVKGTHYFKLTTRDDNTTELIQGEHFEGWGTLFENMESTRRGIVSMNNALQLEISRRRTQDSKEISRSEVAKEDKQDSTEDDAIAQLGISDRPAITAATAAGSFDATSVTACVDINTNFGVDATLRSDEEAKGVVTDSITVKATDNGITTATATAILDSVSVTSSPTEKSEKRISIIGVVSALFSSSKFTPFNRIQPSSSKEDLISSIVPEEQGESGETTMNEIAINEGDAEEGYKEEVEDLVAKQKREAKNAERIELNLDLSDLSFGDFEL